MTTPVKVRLRTVPPVAGLAWIRRGWRTFWRRPLGFFGLWMVLPLLLLLLVLVAREAVLVVAAFPPLLSLGFMVATRDMLDDLPLRPTAFVSPFLGDAGRRRSLLAILAVYVLALFAMAACADAIDGGETRRWIAAFMSMGADGAPPQVPEASATVQAVLRSVSLGIVLLSIPLWHAPALVLWGGQRAAQAMFSSVVALWRTRGAFGLFLLGWFVVLVGYSVLMEAFAAAFGVQAVSLAAFTGQTMLSIAFYISCWFCFADTFEITPAQP